MSTKNIISLSAGIVGFLAGCVLMHYILPDKKVSAKAPVSKPRDVVQQAPGRAHAAVKQAQTAGDGETPEADVQTIALRGAERRRVLGEIKRDKVASVDVPFFATNEFRAMDGTLSREFIDFFELTPAEAGRLTDLIQATRAEMWNAAKAQAMVSQTDTGGVVIKIPPIAEGADIYDKVMGSFQAVLGDERYNDMVFFNNGQLENLFNEFGGEEHTVSIDVGGDGRYKITDFVTGRPGMTSSTHSYTGNLDAIKKRNPELAEFIPTPTK